jgi:hypothetical protein
MIIPFVAIDSYIEFDALLGNLNCRVEVTGNIKSGVTLTVFNPNGVLLASAPVIKSPDWYNNKIVIIGSDYIVFRAATNCFEINGLPTKQRDLSKLALSYSTHSELMIDYFSNYSLINGDFSTNLLDT